MSHSHRGGGASLRPLLALLTVFIAWALGYIWSTSFVIDGERYFALADDMMVSMRYARNLADGHGLVWNPGETPVEGITNLLWTVYMAALHLAAPLADVHLSLLVQLTGLLCLLGVLVAIWRDVAPRLSRAAALAAVAWTAFYLPLNTWVLQGFEVGVLTLILVAATMAQGRALDAGRFAAWPYGLLALATLIRLDAVVFLVAAAVVLALLDPPRRGRHLVWGVALAALGIAAQTAFRAWYFGEWLPNTYFLKVTGYPPLLRMARGAWVFADLVTTANFLVFAAAAAALLLRGRRAARLFAAQFAAASAYSIYVGGDAWDSWGGANRFLAPAMPLVFVLAADTFDTVRAALLARTGHPAAVRVLAVAVAGGILLNLNLRGGFHGLSELALRHRPLFTAGGEHMVRQARRLEPVLAPDARVAVVWAGALPYFLDRPAIDLLGKSDPVVARQPARHVTGTPAYRAFHPGHMKWDYAYSIGTLRPDVVVDLWLVPEEATPVLSGAYLRWHEGDLEVWLRRDSPHIHWSAVRARGQLAE